MTINGAPQSHEVEPRLLLVHYIREQAGLTGTHVGCDTSQCGACTVHVNGMAVKSCTLLAVQCDGAQVLTIERLAKDGKLHPIQDGFWEKHGLQCGFCTPGMIMSAHQMPQRNPGDRGDPPRPGRQPCRCTGYHTSSRPSSTPPRRWRGRGATWPPPEYWRSINGVRIAVHHRQGQLQRRPEVGRYDPRVLRAQPARQREDP
jgi:carbon-monoxide dehydrogenase small subunit